jgi:O-antigen/teichoic acid export membrane protein
VNARGGDGDTATPPAAQWAGAFGSVFLARMVSSGATFLTVILAARALGRGAYGELVILLSVMKVAAELVGPALDTALVRFGARHLESDSDAALRYVRAVFALKIGLAAALIALGILVAWPLSVILSDPANDLEIASLAIAVAFAGAASTVMWAFAQASLQARQKFAQYAGIEMICSVFRFVIVVALLGLGHGRVLPILAAYVAAPAFAAAVAWRGLPKGLFSRFTVRGDVAREVLQFSKWVLVACAFTSLAQRADVFLLTYWNLPREAIGDYGAALQLTLIGDLVILTLFNVLLPKASSLQSAAELRGFLHQFRFPSLLMFAALIPLVIASRWIAVIAFGPEYVRAGTLFAILVLGAAFSLGCAPAGAALYGMGRTRTIATLEGVKLIGIVAGSFLLVPRHGLYAMAWTVAAVKGIVGIATYIVAVRSVDAE